MYFAQRTVHPVEHLRIESVVDSGIPTQKNPEVTRMYTYSHTRQLTGDDNRERGSAAARESTTRCRRQNDRLVRNSNYKEERRRRQKREVARRRLAKIERIGTSTIRWDEKR